MTIHSQFYLTYPSNSSMRYYPNNTKANLTTHLPSSIQPSGDEWEIALVEAHYPYSFLTVGDDAYILLYTTDPEDKSLLIMVKKGVWRLQRYLRIAKYAQFYCKVKTEPMRV